MKKKKMRVNYLLLSVGNQSLCRAPSR